MDDPWSRPGDYVLLRALTDLVCVSSACPCDIDAANGWRPTDVQVRVYGEKEIFRRSIGWRRTPEADVEQTRETGFHESFARHTRDFVEYNGYWLPNTMPAHGSVAEYWACREKAAIMDLSPLRKYEVTGPDAEALLQLGVTRDVRKLSVGQVVYTAMCGEHGGMLDDGTIFRLGENNFRWIGGSDASGLALRELAAARGLNAWVRDSTGQLCNVAVQGPLSREILEGVVWTAPTQPTLEELGWFRFAVGRIGDFHGPAIVVSRTGYSGELGYEVFCHPKDAGAVFERIWAAGEPHGMLPLGLVALDWLRVEAGLVFAGSEFSDRTDPFEAGIGFTVPLKGKEDDFVGRAVLERRQAHPRQALVGLDIEGGVVPSNGRLRARRTGAGRGGHLGGQIARPRQGHRARARRRHACADRHRARDRSARRRAEAPRRERRALPALRSGEEARPGRLRRRALRQAGRRASLGRGGRKGAAGDGGASRARGRSARSKAGVPGGSAGRRDIGSSHLLRGTRPARLAAGAPSRQVPALSLSARQR